MWFCHADERTEDEVQQSDDTDLQHDVSTDFAELKMEEERTDVEESGDDGKDGEADQEDNSQSQNGLTATEDNADDGANLDRKDHLASVVDGHKIESKEATFLEAFSADSALRPKLEKHGEDENFEVDSDATVEEDSGSTTETWKETGEVLMEGEDDQELEKASQEEPENHNQELVESQGEVTEEDHDEESVAEKRHEGFHGESEEQQEVNVEDEQGDLDKQSLAEDQAKVQDDEKLDEEHEEVQEESEELLKPKEKLNEQSENKEVTREEEFKEKSDALSASTEQVEVKTEKPEIEETEKVESEDVNDKEGDDVHQKFKKEGGDPDKQTQSTSNDAGGQVLTDFTKERMSIEQSIRNYQQQNWKRRVRKRKRSNRMITSKGNWRTKSCQKLVW